MPDLDIVGTAAVDIVPIAPTFHEKLRAIVLPSADRVGAEAGRRMGDEISRHIVIALPSAITRGGAAATRAAGQQGDNAGGAFARSLRNKLEVAFRAMPKLDIRLSDTGVDAELARLRARMETLSNKRIGIDVDVAAAEAEVKRIDAELARLGARHPNVAVRADTAAARAALAEFRAEIAAVDAADPRVRVDVDTSAATGAVLRLAAALAVVAAIPIAPPIVAGLGAILAAATAAGAGVGALALAAIPAIKGVTEAITAKTAADKEAATATDNGAAAAKRAASSALQMASAQQTLTSAHRNAARSIAQANRAIEDAERSVAQAAQRAADQRRQAAEAVARAERSLADAKRASRAAEEDLTDARADAARQLDELNDKLVKGKLDEREAALRLKDAEADLAAARQGYDAGLVTDLDMERAQLAYDQAAQAAKQQQKDYAQLQKDAAAAKKAGVDGNESVQDAAQRLADAQRNVQDQTKAVADAHRAAARAEVEAAQTIADAQRGLADAVQRAADTQVQAAESIASAERGVESARLSSLDTTAQATTKADEYRQALAKLSPEQRALFDSIAGPKGLTKAFKDWSRELHPEVLPLFTRAVDGAKNSLPTFTPLVESAATAVGNLMDRASADLKEPFWQGFKKDIQDSAEPAIEGLGVSFGNVVKGMAGVVDAFLPHMDGISDTMQRITGRFAKWGTSLKGSTEFENFLKYVKDTSPGVAEFLGDILEAAFDVAQALAPVSQTAMDILSPLLDGISWVAENAPWAIQVLWGLYAVIQAMKIGIVLFNGAMLIYEVAVAGATLVTSGWAAALAATGIVPLIVAIVVAVAALAAGIVWAYKNVGWFRTAVDTTWKWIKTATEFLWTQGLRPFFEWFGRVIMWLYENVVKPYIGFIISYWMKVGDLFVWLWHKIIKPYVDFMVGYWRWVGRVVSWLWSGVFSPIFGFIGALIAWWWNNIVKKYFGLVMDILRTVGDVFAWLYKVGIKPHVDKISGIVQSMWKSGIKPTFDLVKKGVGLVGDAFGSAKDAIGKNWKQVAGIAAKPVNFIIDWVYTRGIKAAFDGVAKYVGMDPLPKAPKLLDTNPKLLEAGGTVGDGWGVAAPMKVNRPTAIVGEGNPRYPEYVIPTDPKYRGRARALHQAAGTQLLESGGILGGLNKAWDWTKDTVSDVAGTAVDWAKTGADLLVNPSKVWTKLMKPVLAKVAAGVGSAPMGQTLGKLPGKMVDGLKNMIVDAATSMFGGGGGSGEWAKPVSAAFGTRFGVAGSMWSSGHHTGLDFPAPTGTPVRAVDAGSVIGVGRGGPYGNNLEISHGGGLTSLYAHLSKMIVGLGEKVARGQQIGNVGATGNTTGPHLHLEARQNGRAIDPMPYLTGGGGGFSTRAVGAAQQYAKGILSAYGWGPGEFGPLQKLWEGESNWRWNAKNPSSGAYGIPQALPASKMASAGSDWLTNYQTQIRWGLGYIKSRPDYGSPSRAYAKWLSRSPHWYDEGGYLPPGLSLVANGTGAPEPVFTGDQWATLRDAKASGGGPTELKADVRVFVGDRELTDIVRTEINVYDADTATDINNGRWA